MSRLPPLHALAHFEAVARLGTVAAAAKELAVSPSAVSHQIRTLETAMGVGLFRRVKRRLILTEAGERLFQSARDALDLLRDAQISLQGRSERQELVAKMSLSLALSWLMPRLQFFLTDHPEIDLTIDATDTRSDFTSEAIDFDVRYGGGEWGDLFAEPVLTDFMLPVAHPDHPVFRAKGNPRQRLAGVQLLQSAHSRLQWSDWLRHAGTEPLPSGRRLRFTAAVMSVQAAERGLGVALAGSNLLIDALKAGRLKPVFPEVAPIKTEAYWFVCPSRHLQRRPVAEVREWLLAEGQRHEAEMATLLWAET